MDEWFKAVPAVVQYGFAGVLAWPARNPGAALTVASIWQGTAVWMAREFCSTVRQR